jgi:hypothetical protein
MSGPKSQSRPDAEMGPETSKQMHPISASGERAGEQAGQGMFELKWLVLSGLHFFFSLNFSDFGTCYLIR